MKQITALGLLLFLHSFCAFGGNLTVKIDCYLPGTQLNCQEISKSFFDTVNVVEQIGSNPDVEIKIRTLGSDTKTTRYTIEFKGAGKLPSFTIIDEISLNKSAPAATLDIIGDLQKGIYPFLTIAELGQTTKGVYSLKMRGNKDSSNDKLKSSENTGWYETASVSGNANQTQNLVLMATGSGTVNYSNPSWRVLAASSVNYQRVTVTVDDKKETKEVTNLGQRIVVARTLHKGWSVAAVAGAARYTGSNLNGDEWLATGVEWDLIPFLEANDKSFGIKSGIGVEHQDYVVLNILDKKAMTFLGHFTQVYFAWHFDDVDLNGDLSANTKLDDLNFSSVNANFGLTWRISKKLAASMTVSGTARRKIINAPKDEPGSDALQQFLDGGNYAKLSWSSGLNLSYTFGNSVLYRRDQRWAH